MHKTSSVILASDICPYVPQNPILIIKAPILIMKTPQAPPSPLGKPEPLGADGISACNDFFRVGGRIRETLGDIDIDPQ